MKNIRMIQGSSFTPIKEYSLFGYTYIKAEPKNKTYIEGRKAITVAELQRKLAEKRKKSHVG